MNEPQIPNFLLTDVYTMSVKSILGDLQRLSLWQYVNGSKPYDHKAAIRLQSELRAHAQTKMRKDAKKRAEAIEKVEKEAMELHRKIAELAFIVEFADSEKVGVREVGWNSGIKDQITGKTVGTPRSLFSEEINVDFRLTTDARDNLERYLDELFKTYHNWSYDFSFDRAHLRTRLPIFRVETAPFKAKANAYFSFTLRLVQKRIGVRSHKKMSQLVKHA